MADIAIKMGVNGPEDDVDGIMSIFNYVYQQDPKTDETDFIFEAHESDFMWTDAVGFVQSKPCLHMTYDEAVAYLQNKIAELSK